MRVKEVPEYYTLVLNILCMTNFVTSLVIVFTVRNRQNMRKQ